MTPAPHTTAPEALALLKPSPRMPVLFVGHGSPMNAIEHNRWRARWQAVGELFGLQGGARYPLPQLVLCVSAHWVTHRWALTGMPQPRTLHDFGGFPDELFAVRYPAPGWPEAAQGLARTLQTPHPAQALTVDTHQWGLDHGAWGVLQPMFPSAQLPVIQLSLAHGRPGTEHAALGQQLRMLRERGVLIVASGNLVHNLRALNWHNPEAAPPEWAEAFDALATEHLERGDTAALAVLADAGAHRQPGGLGALTRQAHPTNEHFLPLLYAAGATHASEAPAFFNEGFQLGSIGMRSALWG